MRDRTYGGFKPSRLGYKRFRDLLVDAESRGLISVDRTRRGDVAVSLPSGGTAVAAPAPAIRSDLWKIFIDWKIGQLRYYDIELDKALMVPEERAPLEPDKFGEMRARLEHDPNNFIPITPIAQHTQLGWMRQFADTMPDVELKTTLQAALIGYRPAKMFVAVLKEVPTELHRWHHELQQRVRAEIEKWRDSVSARKFVDIDEKIDIEKTGPARSAKSRGLSSQSNSPVGIRALLHSAIDRMPLEELKALRIPVGFLIEE
jgi:hypothetical protein